MREQRRTIADFESGNLSLAQLAAFLTINLTYTSRHLENFLENVSDFISGFAAVEKTYEEDVDNVELLWELMRFEEATKWQIAAVKLNRRCGAMLHDYSKSLFLSSCILLGSNGLKTKKPLMSTWPRLDAQTTRAGTPCRERSFAWNLTSRR